MKFSCQTWLPSFSFIEKKRIIKNENWFEMKQKKMLYFQDLVMKIKWREKIRELCFAPLNLTVLPFGEIDWDDLNFFP